MVSDLLNVPADYQIVSSRVIKANPEIVFNAWTNPELLRKWWGPKGFSNTFKTFDLRPGGTWAFTMHGPEKGNYQNEVVFLKIEKPKLIAWDRVTQPLFRIVATFDPTPEGYTNLVFRMQFDSREACEKIRKFVPDKNEENFDRLEAVLEDRQPV